MDRTLDDIVKADQSEEYSAIWRTHGTGRAYDIPPDSSKCFKAALIEDNEKNTKMRSCLDGLGSHGGLHLGHLDSLVLGSPEAGEAGEGQARERTSVSGGTGTGGGGTGRDGTGGDGTGGGRGGLVAHLGAVTQL
jgi:hypothetical protein